MGHLSVGLVALLMLGPIRGVEDAPQEHGPQTTRERFEKLVKRHGATTPGEQCQALVKEYDEARGNFERALKGAKNDDQRRAIRDKNYVGPEQYTHLFQMLARRHPKGPVARDALVWIGSHDPAGPEGHEAMQILPRDHMGSDKLGSVCDAVGNLPKAEAETFLRTVAEKSPYREVRTRATFALALILKRWSDNAPDLADTRSERAQRMSRYFGEAVAARIRKNPRAITEEAERLFQRVVETAGDVAFVERPFGGLGATNGGRIAEIAERALFEMRYLSVGKPAPEIAAEDLDGRTMKLSEFRGRVVVVNFWATWCGPCMALVPHERELVKRLEGEQFVLVGVNGDEDRDTARQAVKREAMTWRSWWDGGSNGPTATRWNVRGWPAIYILDRQGIIRHKWNESPGAESLQIAIESVLK